MHAFLRELQPSHVLMSMSSEDFDLPDGSYHSRDNYMDGLTHFQVDEIFDVEGVGRVVSGTVVNGRNNRQHQSCWCL